MNQNEKHANTNEELKFEEIDAILDEVEQNEAQYNKTGEMPSIITNDISWHNILNEIKHGNVGFLKTIITSNEIDVNAQNPDTSMTLLHYAVIIGNMELIQTLLNFGADCLIKDNEGEDALDYAIKYGRYNCTEILYYQQLSGSLGRDLKNIATTIHRKQLEAKYFMKNIKSDAWFSLLEFLCKAMEDKQASACGDLLFYAWYYVLNHTEDQYSYRRNARHTQREDPLESELFKSMMKVYNNVLGNTADKDGWKWLKEHFITSLIWYLPHPKLNETEIDDDDDDAKDDLEMTLQQTLFWELLVRVRDESKKQSELLLKGKINKIKSEKINEWNDLIRFNVVTKYSNNARQDTCHCLVPKYKESELSIDIYPPSIHFNALKHYDTEIYLNELLFRANTLDKTFQRDMKLVTHDILKENKDINYVSYRAGPVKTLSRSQTKVENDYISEVFPTSAKILDINRCALQFRSIECMMKFIALFQRKIEENKAYSIVDIIRCKNGWSVYDEKRPQYTDIKLNVLVKDGGSIVAEVQFLLSLMSSFKKKAHKLYAIERKYEFVYNFSKIKNKMNKFKVHTNNNDIFIDLAKHDNVKQFTILWSVQPTIDVTLFISTVHSPLPHIINKNGEILKFLVNGHKDFCYDSIAAYLHKFGLPSMIKEHIPIKEGASFVETMFTFIENTFNSADVDDVKNEDDLILKSLLSRSQIRQDEFATNTSAYTALEWTSQHGYIEILKIIIKYATTYNILHHLFANFEWKSALMIAVERNQTEIVQELCKHIQNHDIFYINFAGRSALICAAEVVNPEIVECILDYFKNDKNAKHKLLFHQDDYGKTALIASGSGHIAKIFKIRQMLLNAIDDPQIKMDFISVTDKKNNTILMHIQLNDMKLLLNIMNSDPDRKRNLIFHQNDIGHTVLMSAIKRKDIETVDFLLNQLTEEDKLKLLSLKAKADQNNTALHYVMAHKKKGKKLLNNIFAHIKSNDDLFLLLFIANDNGEIPFHVAGNALFCELFNRSSTSDMQLYQLLSTKDHEGYTPLMKVWTQNSWTKSSMEIVLDYYMENESKRNQLLQLLNQIENVSGWTVLMMLCSEGCFRKVVLLISTINDDNISEQLFNMKSKIGQNCYDIAEAKDEHDQNKPTMQFIKTFLEYVKWNGFMKEEDEMKYDDTMYQQLQSNVSPFIAAAQLNKYEFIRKVLMSLKDKNDIKSHVLQVKLKFFRKEETPMLIAAQNGYHHTVKAILDNVNQEIAMELLCYNITDTYDWNTKILQDNRWKTASHCGYDSNTIPLIIASEKGEYNVVKVILDHLKGYNDNECLLKILLHETAEHRTCFSAAFESGSTDIIKEILTVVDDNEIYKMLLQKENRKEHKYTPLMIAAENGRNEVIKFILKLYQKKYKELLYDVDENNNTILMIAAKHNSVVVIKEILNVFIENNDYDGMVELLFCKNNEDENVLFLCLINEYQVVQYIVNSIKNEDKLKLILETTKANDYTFVMHAMRNERANDKLSIIDFLLSNINDENTKLELLSKEYNHYPAQFKKEEHTLLLRYNNNLQLLQVILKHINTQSSALQLLNTHKFNDKTYLENAKKRKFKEIIQCVENHLNQK